MVKANVDKILEVLRQNKSASVGELSKSLGLKSADIQKSAEYLEQDGVVKIEHKFPRVVITLLKDPEPLAKASMPVPPPVSKPATEAETKIQNSIINTANSFDPNFVPQQKEAPAVPQNMPQQTYGQQATAPPPVIVMVPVQTQPMPAQIPSQQPVQIQSQPSVQIQSQAPVQSMIPPKFPAAGEANKIEINMNPASNQSITPKKIEESTLSARPVIPAEKKLEVTPDDPLDLPKPRFDLAPPIPGNSSDIRPIFLTDENVTIKETSIKETSIDFPNYIKSDIDKIEFMLDMIEKKLSRHEFSDLNSFYRKAYDIYSSSRQLSPNEIYLLGERLQESFDRVKHVYLVEEAV